MLKPKPQVIRQALWRVASPALIQDPQSQRQDISENATELPPDLKEATSIDSQYFDIFSRPVPPRSASWSIWWSDLMMTMFIMFAALYAFQIPKTSLPVHSDPVLLAQATSAKTLLSADPILDRIYGQLAATIKRFEQETMFTLHLVPDSAIHLIIHGNTLFSPGAKKNNTSLHLCLQELALIMRSSPYDLAVIGHASPYEAQAKKTDAWTLSVNKSSAVLAYLTQQASFPSHRIYIVGYGDQRPLGTSVELAQGHEDGRVELVLSTVNTTAPLPHPQESEQGFRQWLAASTQGE
ncbi:MAG: OmpA family protein [Desulfomicrobium sp.]|jgi:flagellar motor protein MotB|nr:OmpA family protein [Desulfomicrobium sp.]